VLDALANWAGQWEDFHQDVERIIDAGDQVVGLVCHHGRGKQSGAPVELRLGYVHTIKDGKSVRWEMFGTWSEALKAAGLPHEPCG
jgi:ketosteroid isomerase-like protein